MELDLERLHAQRNPNDRRKGKTVYACTLVAGALDLLQSGETITVFIKYMDRAKHFTQTLFEVLPAMHIELPTKKGDNLYFENRNIHIVFRSIQEERRKHSRVVFDSSSSIAPIYDLD